LPHSALSFRFVAWALDHGGAEVRGAVRAFHPVRPVEPDEPAGIVRRGTGELPNTLTHPATQP